MRKLLPFALTVLFVLRNVAYSEDMSFEHCRLTDAKGAQAKATLVFRDSFKDVAIQAAARESISIPYENLDKITYDYSKKHRITKGAILLAVTPFGAGGLVMLTKSKSNWLNIDFHDQDGKKTVVLKLEKRDLERIFDAFKTHTGKEVVRLGEAGKG